MEKAGDLASLGEKEFDKHKFLKDKRTQDSHS